MVDELPRIPKKVEGKYKQQARELHSKCQKPHVHLMADLRASKFLFSLQLKLPNFYAKRGWNLYRLNGSARIPLKSTSESSAK